MFFKRGPGLDLSPQSESSSCRRPPPPPLQKVAHFSEVTWWLVCQHQRCCLPFGLGICWPAVVMSFCGLWFSCLTSLWEELDISDLTSAHIQIQPSNQWLPRLFCGRLWEKSWLAGYELMKSLEGFTKDSSCGLGEKKRKKEWKKEKALPFNLRKRSWSFTKIK